MWHGKKTWFTVWECMCWKPDEQVPVLPFHTSFSLSEYYDQLYHNSWKLFSYYIQGNFYSSNRRRRTKKMCRNKLESTKAKRYIEIYLHTYTNAHTQNKVVKMYQVLVPKHMA